MTVLPHPESHGGCGDRIKPFFIVRMLRDPLTGSRFLWRNIVQLGGVIGKIE
jgi:hypothetical protein